ncbi:DUF1292 domain-containing protein [Salinithrix halophila]|uniref:UPF0473 protein ACFOUO_08470 n=1 Tax=Salinithrix halophila TaxID=1485204 RepID=A0ABV8JLJ6_9BACL
MNDNGHHDHEQEHPESEMVIISNDEGEQESFQVLYRFEQDNGNKYILLTPVDEPEGAQENDEPIEQEVYAFRYEGEGEQFSLMPIEDDNEWDMVEEVLRTLETEFDEDES